jgi:hypothetical protein
MGRPQVCLEISRRGPRTAKRADDLEEILGDHDFILQEILEPQVILTMRQRDERQQVRQANSYRGRLNALVLLFITRWVYSQ